MNPSERFGCRKPIHAGLWAALTIFLLFQGGLVFGQMTIFQFTFEDQLTPVVNNSYGTPLFTSSGVGGLNFNATTPCEGLKMYQGSYWTIGDFYQFTVNTTGYSSLVFSYCERGSNVLIGTFLVRVSPDGTNWTIIRTDYTPPLTNTTNTGLLLPVSCNNTPIVYIQIYKTSSPTSTGQSLRIDNAILTGMPETDPPQASFVPDSGASNVLLTVTPVITFNEPVRKTDGSPLNDSDLNTLITLNKTDASGEPVAFSATINTMKTEITITPVAALSNAQLYFIATGPVEDQFGNESQTQSSLFTTVGTGISSDATLSDLSIGGSTVAGFSPSTLNYSHVLPYGTVDIPVVMATPNFGLATVEITSATTIPGTTQIVVTAQDGTTQLTYSVAFAWDNPSSDATLRWIKWGPSSENNNKVIVTGFEPATLTYSVTVPSSILSAGMAAQANFTPGTGLPGATVEVTQPSNLEGTAAERTGTVLVTAQDGITTATYQVTFSLSESSGFHFREGFEVNPPAGWTISPNIGSTTASNNVGLYPGTTSPKFKWLPPADGGTISLPAFNTAGTLEFYVRVLDNLPANNLHLYIEKSYNDSVWIPVAQDPMPLYGSTATWYQAVVQVNDPAPQVYLRFRGSATFGTNSTGLFYLDDVSMTMLSDADATLSDLRADGSTIANFTPQVTDYSLILPPGTTTIPVVTATPAQSAATVQITPALSIPGTTTLIVTAADGITTMTYTVVFSHQLISPGDLTASVLNPSVNGLTWSDPNENESGTRIERKPDGGLFAQIGNVPANVTGWNDTIVPGMNPDAFVAANRFSSVNLTSGVKFTDVINYKGVPTSLYLDVYEPAGDLSEGRPVIIWIHGGGFRTDSYRTQGYIVDYCNRFARRGYVCVSIDYRLREAADMPTQASEFPALQDAARDANAAIDWIRANAAIYRVDPNLVFIAGGSAGGRTAQTVCQFDGPDTAAVNAPENLYQSIPWNKTGLVANATLWGGLEPEMRGWVYPYLQPTDLPTILVHGSADITILPQESIDLNDTLTATGVTSELHIIPGATHSCLGYETQIAAWVADFFAREWKKVRCETNSYTYRVKAWNPYGVSLPSANDTVEVGFFPSAPGEITGPDTVVRGASGVVFSVEPLLSATGYSWSLPEGASILSAADSNVITVDFAENTASGAVTVCGINGCGNGPLSEAHALTVIPPLPLHVTLGNDTVAASSVFCSSAIQTITVAGNGSSWLVVQGGSATLIAGQRILMLPGTTVEPGGYLDAHIVGPSGYCPDASPVKSRENYSNAIPEFRTGNKLALFPNPTTGCFTILMAEGDHETEAEAEIIHSTGTWIKTIHLTPGKAVHADLEGMPAGLYLLRVPGNPAYKTTRIMKL